MLFQVIALCTLLVDPNAPAIRLHPQFHADDQDDLKDQLGKWLDDTGYALALHKADDSGEEVPALLEVTVVDAVTGLAPEVQAVRDLATENASLKEQLTSLLSSTREVDGEDTTKKLASAEQALGDAVSKIATLEAQLKEALKLPPDAVLPSGSPDPGSPNPITVDGPTPSAPLPGDAAASANIPPPKTDGPKRRP